MFIYSNSRKIYLKIWDKVQNPKGIIHIVHGMAEYGERYEKFALYLNHQGYIVSSNDLFGHKSSINNCYGELSTDGFSTYTQDAMSVLRYLKSNYEIPIHLLGHSMGSFIVQYLMLEDINFIHSYILLGSNYTHTLKTFFGYKLINFVNFFRCKKEDVFIDRLLFGNFNNKFEKRTKFDWLSKNVRNVDTYINDPYCGQVYPSFFYKSFISALYKLHIPSSFQRIKNKRNILILSGASDPVGEYSKGISKLAQFFIDNSFNVQFELYEMLRHELLNECEHLNIYERILSFVNYNEQLP